MKARDVTQCDLSEAQDDTSRVTLTDPCSTVPVSVADGGIGSARTDIDGFVLKKSEVKNK